MRFLFTFLVLIFLGVPVFAQSPFEVDEHTMALFHCDETEGIILHDCSGHNC